MKIAYVFLLSLAFLSSSVFAQAPKSPAAPVAAATAPAPAAKVLSVGTDTSFPPFAYQWNNQIVGFDVEILKAIAAKAGFEVKFFSTPWKGLFGLLASGDRDILASAISIWDTRKKDMDFSNPYFEALQVIVVPPTSKATKLDDLKNLKVGVQFDTSGDEMVSALMGKTNPNLRRFPDAAGALKALQSGEVAAVVVENGFIANYSVNNKLPFKQVIDPKLSKESYGIAVKKGRKDLLDKINKGLAAIKADGSYDRIYKKYFGPLK